MINYTQRVWYFSFLACIIVFTIFHTAGWCYYEEYESALSVFFSGKATDGVPVDITSTIYIGWGYILVRLYNWWPGVYWYDLLMNAANCISCPVISAVVYSEVRRVAKPSAAIIAAVAVFILFLLPQVISQNYTRVSFLLCLAAFALLAGNNFPAKLKSIRSVTAVLLFIAGSFLRYESAGLVLILSGIYFLSRLLIEKRKSYLMKSGLLVMAFLPAVLYLALLNRGGGFQAKLSPMDEFKIGLRYTVPESSMKTAADSIKYVALQEGILNDPHVITIDFMKSVVREGLPLNGGLIARAAYLLGESASDTLFGMMGCFLLIVIAVISSKRKEGYTVIIMVLLFALTLFAIALAMKMEKRIMEPVVAMLAICLVIVIAKNTGVNNKAVFFSGLVIAACGIYNDIADIKIYKERAEIHAGGLERLKEVSRGKLLVADTYCFMVMFYDNLKPFTHCSFDWAKDIFQADMEAYSLAPGYITFLEKHCACDATRFGNLFEYFYQQRGNLVFAANAARLNFFQKYLETIYGRHYNFIRQGTIMELSGDKLPEAQRLKMVTTPVNYYTIADN